MEQLSGLCQAWMTGRTSPERPWWASMSGSASESWKPTRTTSPRCRRLRSSSWERNQWVAVWGLASLKYDARLGVISGEIYRKIFLKKIEKIKEAFKGMSFGCCSNEATFLSSALHGGDFNHRRGLSGCQTSCSLMENIHHLTPPRTKLLAEGINCLKMCLMNLCTLRHKNPCID